MNWLDKLGDAILARPDTTLSVLLLLGVIGALIWLIRHLVSAHKEASVATASAIKEVTAVVSELRIDVAAVMRSRSER